MAKSQDVFFNLAKVLLRHAFRRSPIIGEALMVVEILQDLNAVRTADETDPQVQRIKKQIREWKKIANREKEQ